MIIAREDPDAIVGSFSADHSITNVDEFRLVIDQAVAAAETGDIVTIGIMPRNPATAYGYIETGDLLGLEGAPTARRALAFAEKPEASTARQYVNSGRYRWNAGMFIAKASSLLDILAEEDPPLYSGLARIAEAWDTPTTTRCCAPCGPDWRSEPSTMWWLSPRLRPVVSSSSPVTSAGTTSATSTRWPDCGSRFPGSRAGDLDRREHRPARSRCLGSRVLRRAEDSRDRRTQTSSSSTPTTSSSSPPALTPRM